MPQINRVRVNNVKYNFGTQYYDDFMMRFNCGNTIYDLANGGGKSLLMLLLLQNVIPNCTLDDKQPIEKLFRAGGGNTVIHSLIEWKLDSCYRKDNYKYMTTGFCARKANGAEGDGQMSLADGSDDNSNVSRDNSSIEYFNYAIFYREFGDNDIKNLPLTSNGERITYNGLKAYLRDLEKKDFGVSVKIFDRKGDYQNFLTQYGIFESQWEIVRGINKTEGHVRTYFESNYKTSRKVVEDLLIEEIIQKSFNNRLGVDNDEGRMAQTLLDIKDKLLELSRKNAQLNAYDGQMSAIEEFAQYTGSFVDLYKQRESLENQLYTLLVACKYDVMDKEEAVKSLERLMEKIDLEIVSENRAIQTAEIISQQNSLNAICEMIEVSEQSLKLTDEKIAALRAQLTNMESANDYKDYSDYEKLMLEVNETIGARLMENSEILAQLRTISDIFYENNKFKAEELREKCELSENEIKRREADGRTAEEKLRNAQQKAAVDKSLVSFTEAEISNEEKHLASLMEKAGLLVVENLLKEENDLEEEISLKESLLNKELQSLDSTNADINNCKAVIAGLDVRNELLKKELEKAEQMAADDDKGEERIAQLMQIYAASDISGLAQTVISMYGRMDTEYRTVKSEAEQLELYIQNAMQGRYSCKSPYRDRLKEYLVSRYGDDVVEGYEWFEALNPGQKRDVFKRAPFVEYSFVIKGDFDRIKEDATLENFGYGAYTVPVISENILYDTKLEVNKELVKFAMKDMNFLRDNNRLQRELSVATEELEALNAECEKLADRKAVVWEDYLYIVGYDAINKRGFIADREQLNAELEDNEAKKNAQIENYKKLEAEAVILSENIASMKKILAGLDKKRELFVLIREKNEIITDKYESLRAARDVAKQSVLQAEADKASYEQAMEELESVKAVYASLKLSYDRLMSDWEDNYKEYYEDGKNRVEEPQLSSLRELNDKALESKFFGLKEALNKETVDVADKEKLLSHYKISMDKCKNAIEYRGSDFEFVKAEFEAGRFAKSSPAKLMEVKSQLNGLIENTRKERDELEARNALMNRLEGSIAHGIHQIEQKYGEYNPFECENPEGFINQHKELIKKLELNIKDIKAKYKDANKSLKDVYVVEKDLERIVSNAGLDIPVIRYLADETGDNKLLDRPKEISRVNISEYEAVSKDYDKHIKLVYKKRDEFNKHRQQLVDLLEKLEASELAGEVRVSVRVPETIAQTEALISNLKETNTFIQLEKDRISKGIEDMQRIKDNFENRCIQTCSNIKTELDRLPKLSNIVMDNETISIIGLSIPYIREELYKDRMAAYIDETIVMAESFKEQSERLKYIRNRLTWKKLFSVIVTDMNAIRIDLYKRERIKDQSRYLKYEEAVGSTGQSQGIYIQFLIAIINYISSINAFSAENSVLGKTIFIDNPFGAAKDIYIWEPIFKLLKTNHVQLIVPARGATPAITGRFDVNYILGQKLVDGRQQTVVVDYYSRTNQAQMEYTRMDYEQATLNFI